MREKIKKTYRGNLLKKEKNIYVKGNKDQRGRNEMEKKNDRFNEF